MREPETFYIKDFLVIDTFINNLVENHNIVVTKGSNMAISRDKKQSLVTELTDVLKDAKMFVFAQYEGLSVAELQTLRRSAREQNVQIKVVKNRLVRVALKENNQLKDADTSLLKGQLLYAISADDEVAPAQVLAAFAKKHAALQLIGAISAEGTLLATDEVKALATLPSKNELIAQVLATLSSPLNDVMGGLSGNLHGLLDGIEAKAA